METICSDSLKGPSSCPPQKKKKGGKKKKSFIPHSLSQRLGPSVCTGPLAACLNYSLGVGLSVFKAGSIPLNNRAFLIKALCPPGSAAAAQLSHYIGPTWPIWYQTYKAVWSSNGQQKHTRSLSLEPPPHPKPPSTLFNSFSLQLSFFLSSFQSLNLSRTPPPSTPSAYLWPAPV